MKKTLIKIVVFLLVFVATVFTAGMVMNKDHSNRTIELASATYPLMTMESDQITYNELHGYGQPMNTAFQRDTVTVLGDNRNTTIRIDTYGWEISRISMQVRSLDGSRLIEDTEITDYTRQQDTIKANVALKDLIDKDTQYSLAIILESAQGEKIYFYTRVVWGDALHVAEKLTFVKDFHASLYDKEAAGENAKYLETNSRLDNNSSFHKVTIHSSFQQITWGDLSIVEVGTPSLQLTEIAGATATVLVNFMVATAEERNITYYLVQEYYRVRYTTERMYLLDYERTMTQIPDETQMYANDKLLLGITDERVDMTESADGNVVVFSVAGKLLSYNTTTNKLVTVFSFYDAENADARTLYQQHAIKILDVDEGGNLLFAVYGYMNRGRHEGENGVQVCYYNSSFNTIEEEIYLPYEKSFSVLKEEMEKLLYMNRERKLYLTLENKVYGIDLKQKNYKILVDRVQDGSMQVSDNHRILVWQEGEENYSNCLKVRNLNLDREGVVEAAQDEVIRLLGFMGEDVIYGVARTADILTENSGRIFCPLYKVCICDSTGKVLKEYRQENVYVTECSVADNQITLVRYCREENGSFCKIADDHIMNNVEEESGKNVVVTVDTERYEKYVQIQTRVDIDSKTIKLLTPKEVVFEGVRELELIAQSEILRYYVYSGYGVEGIYTSPAKAVSLAYEKAGLVIDEAGECVWKKETRVARNQIMAITEQKTSEDRGSLAVCLDTILAFEGIICNTQELLDEQYTATEILQENLPDAQVLELTGCTLDAVLYYVNRDIPVLAMLENGEAVLVTGFNEFNVVIMNPAAGTLKKEGMNDSTAWFLENGNRFVTYQPG